MKCLLLAKCLCVGSKCLSVDHSLMWTHCNPWLDYSHPGFSVHGILQARILQRISRGSSQHRDGIQFPVSQADSLLYESCGGLLEYNWRNALKCPSDIRKWAYEEKRSRTPGSWWTSNQVQCKVDISPQISFLTCLSSILVSYLVFLGNLLHEECVVTTVFLRPLAKPANGLVILLTEEQEFLFMAQTDFSPASPDFSPWPPRATPLARCQWGHRFPGPYLILNTGHLLSPSRPIMDSLLFAVLQAWQKLWPQSRLKGSVRSSRQMGQVNFSCRFTNFLEAMATCPLLSWILRILSFTDLRIIGKDKRDRVRKVEIDNNNWL